MIKAGEELLRLQAENQQLNQKLNAIKELSDEYENELSMYTASYYMEKIREIFDEEKL